MAGPGGDSTVWAMKRHAGRVASLCCAAALRATLAGMAIAGILAVPSASYAVTTRSSLVPSAATLPDGRVYELVSPAVKNGNEAGVLGGGESSYGVADASGGRVMYSGTGPLGEAQSGVENFSVSERSATGWTTKAALPPPVAPIGLQDPVSLSDPTSLVGSEDLTKVAFTSFDPFAPSSLNFADPEFSFAGAYLAEASGAATWIGAATVERPVPRQEEVGSPEDMTLVGASPDLGTVYFQYYGTLIPEDAPRLPAVEGGAVNAWGLYEWRAGRLRAAGLLPEAAKEHPGEEDPFGAVAAGIGGGFLNATAPDYSNEVSRSGGTVLFVSPAPEAASGRPSELYARINGTTTVLISRSDLTGQPSSTGVDGIRDLSQSHLVPYAYASPDGSHVYFTSEDQLTADAPAKPSLDEYQFNLKDDTLTYLAAVTAPIVASSEGGDALLFDDSRESSEPQLAIWQGGRTVDIAPLPATGGLYVAPAHFVAGASAVVFQTNAALPGFNNGGGFGEIYRYDVASAQLSCISCPPTGQSPVGTANLSNDALHHSSPLMTDSRGVSEDGSEIFFDTPNQLVPQDKNEARDVYEWHDGSLSLISPGKDASDSFFLDNSASGNDVFFATRANLTGSDVDGSFDVYDARVGGGFPVSAAPSGCASSCSSAEGGSLPQGTLASKNLLGAGEQVVQTPTGKPISSRAQKLARSLKACRKERGRRRHVCEARARRRYGASRTRRALTGSR